MELSDRCLVWNLVLVVVKGVGIYTTDCSRDFTPRLSSLDLLFWRAVCPSRRSNGAHVKFAHCEQARYVSVYSERSTLTGTVDIHIDKI